MRPPTPRIISFARISAVSACALLLGAACVSPGNGDAAPAVSLRHQSTTEDQCGPTTLASVLDFYGVSVPEETISEAIFSPTARGVLITDLARIAREYEFDTRIASGTLKDLAAHLDQGHPPIVLLDMGLGQRRVPHFTAVTGVTQNGVFILGDSPKNPFHSTRMFERLWTRAGNQYLLLSPRSSAGASSF